MSDLLAARSQMAVSLAFHIVFAVIGIGSRFIRHTLLSGLARELGTPESRERERPLPGDALLLDARASLTHGITIDRTPREIGPWLLQRGCDRAGYYSIDLLDNEGHRSAREVHPDLQSVRVGDVLPARPGRKDGFEVLQEVTGRTARPYAVIRIVGGGSQNRLLNQWTADACTRDVVTGPVEATALGLSLIHISEPTRPY